MVALIFGFGTFGGMLSPLGAMAGQSGCPAVCGGVGGIALVFVVFVEIQVKKVIVLPDRHYVLRQGRASFVVKDV